jgi:toxin ParE1/3/4
MKYGKSPNRNTTPNTSRKKAELRLSPAAEQDLINIALYGMEQFGIEQSEQYRDKLKQRFQELSEAPLMYPAVDDIREGYRRSVFGAHSIYYCILSDYVEIVRVIGRQSMTIEIPPEQ